MQSSQANVTQPTYKRRKTKKLLIYPKFQLRLVAINAIILLAAFGVLIFQVWLSLGEIRRMGASMGLPEGHAYFAFVDKQIGSEFSYALLTAFAAILATTCASFLLSHRLAGPVVRLKSFFGEIAKTGRVTPLKFRKDDFFVELPDLINEALRRVKDNNT